MTPGLWVAFVIGGAACLAVLVFAISQMVQVNGIARFWTRRRVLRSWSWRKWRARQ